MTVYKEDAKEIDSADKEIVYKEGAPEIDFSAKKTEYEWGETRDKFFLEATPKIFEWMRWIIVLAVVSYIKEISDSTAIKILLWILYIFTYGYFYSYFYQFKFFGFPGLKTDRARFLGSLFFSFLLTLATILLVTESIRIIAKTYPISQVEQDIEKAEQPEMKPSVKTEMKEKINSSTQPTKTLTKTNEKSNISDVKEQLTDPKVQKDQLQEEQP